MLTVALDETHRIAVARLDPGQSLLVTAPTGTTETNAENGESWRPYVVVRFDDFGVRPQFWRTPQIVHASLAGRDVKLVQAVKRAIAEIDASGAPGVARIVFEPTGTKRKTVWRATGDYEVVSDDPDARQSFWPPLPGDVWLACLDAKLPDPWVCPVEGRLRACGIVRNADQVWAEFGPLRLIWRDGQPVTAHHASQLPAKAGD